MHVTGKVINMSDDDIDMDETVSDLSSDIASTFSGSIEIKGSDVEFNTDVQLEKTNSMDDVDKSDHLFVLANGTAEEGKARGTTNEIGGKVMHLYSGDYPTNSWYSPGWSNTRSAVHEFGHAAGLKHSSYRNDLMRRANSGSNINSMQRLNMYRNRNSVNKGFNSVTLHNGRKIPNPSMRAYNSKTHRYEKGHINNFGLYIKQ